MDNKNIEYHIPVLYEEVLANLITDPNGVYLDCTLGGGGHSQGILEKLGDKGHLIAIDQDQDAIDFSKKRLEKYGNKIDIYKKNFVDLDIVLYMAGYDKVDGILMDIGVSSDQLDDPSRGFSYRYDVKLDMRMDQDAKISAYDVVNKYPEEQLSNLIYEYGEERHARKIARYICEERQKKPIETTFELVSLIKKAYPERAAKHPAKKTFQALRIEVNKELEVLEKAIKKAVSFLKPGGRIAVITFHSLEDRLVKNLFRDMATACKCPPGLPVCVCGGKADVKIITKKPIMPSENEIEDNNRAHSSKLRVAERL